MWRSIVAARCLRRLAFRQDVTVMNGLFVLAALRLTRLRSPVVWLVHDVLRKGVWTTLIRLAGSVVNLAVAVSDGVATPLRSLGIHVEVVPNGTPWPVEPHPGTPPSPPIVGCAALLVPWKGQLVLLEAAAGLPEDVRVELVGGHFPKDAPYVESLVARADEADLRGRVEFVGHVDDALARMRTWSVAVSASVEPEAGPLVALEAMSIGLPVVGTDLGNTPRVIGDAGLLVPSGEPDALKDALERLLSDRDLWQRCHEEGPRAVRDRLTVGRQMDDLLRLLSDVADGSMR